MEIIVLFTILYLFLTLIDKSFTDLLFFRSCAVDKGIGFIKLVVWIAETDRSFINWMFKLIGVGALIFITNLVIQKVPDVVGSIVSIGGVGAGEGGGSGMAGGMLSGAFGLGKMAAGGLGEAAAFVGDMVFVVQLMLLENLEQSMLGIRLLVGFLLIHLHILSSFNYRWRN